MSETTQEHFECWLVRLRNEEGYITSMNHDFGSWNTLKFASHSAALAWCRRNDIDPRDHVIVRARFQQPDVLETREIDYGVSSLMLAVADAVLNQTSD